MSDSTTVKQEQEPEFLPDDGFERFWGKVYERRYGPDWRKDKVCGQDGYLCAFCSGKITKESWSKSNVDHRGEHKDE